MRPKGKVVAATRERRLIIIDTETIEDNIREERFHSIYFLLADDIYTCAKFTR
jgi:hypothetical protein